MTGKIYQVKITLKRSKPAIWRTLLIPAEMRLGDLHRTIQIAFGWENSHLHQFIKDRKFYTVRFPNDDFWDDLDNVDYKKDKTCIFDLLNALKESIIYEYDFGDSWEHEIVLEKILPVDPQQTYPICLDGRAKRPSGRLRRGFWLR